MYLHLQYQRLLLSFNTTNLFLIRFIIEFFWYRRWLVSALLTALVVTAGHLLKLNSNYYYYIAFVVTISTMVYSIYNTFLTELIYLTKDNFAYGIHEQYVSEIFDCYTKKRHKGPFYKHNLKKGWWNSKKLKGLFSKYLFQFYNEL